MSAPRIDRTELGAPPLAGKFQGTALIIGAIFSVLAIVGFVVNPEEFYRAYLVAYMGWLGLSLGCLALVMLVHLTGGAWGMVVRRIWEAGSRTLSLMIVLFIPLIFGMNRLYIWLNPVEIAKSKHLQEITQTYLTQRGWILRAVFYFAIWAVMSFLLNRWSAEQDSPSFNGSNQRFRMLSAPGLVVYGFTISFASIDWVMSLDPSWISTIYGLLFIVGEALFAMCLAVIVEALLENEKPFSTLLQPTYVHDHGKLTLAFVMLWAYFNFSQWLIIWAGNLPDEITFYMARLHGGWEYVGLSLACFHFFAPFFLLLSRSFKRKTRTLVWVSLWLVLMRFVDLFWLIEPNFYKTFHLSWITLVLPIAMGGLWFALFFHNLRSRPMLPLYDPNSRKVLEPAHHAH
jgi:hypothetical protein